MACPGSASVRTEACGGHNVLLSFPAASMRNASVPHPPAPLQPKGDSRWTESGHIIMSEKQIYYPPVVTKNHTQVGYACQPYCFVYPDGEWSCGAPHQHFPPLPLIFSYKSEKSLCGAG